MFLLAFSCILSQSSFLHLKKSNFSLLLHDRCSTLCCPMAFFFTSLSSFFLIFHGFVLNYTCRQKKMGKGKQWGKISFQLSQNEIVNCNKMFLEEIKPFSFQVNAFYLPPLSFGPSIESEKSICHRAVITTQETARNLATPIEMTNQTVPPHNKKLMRAPGGMLHRQLSCK